MIVCATEKGICLLETEFRDLQKRLNATIMAGENHHAKQARLETEEYFAGRRKRFSLELHTPGTDFPNQVWESITSRAC